MNSIVEEIRGIIAEIQKNSVQTYPHLMRVGTFAYEGYEEPQQTVVLMATYLKKIDQKPYRTITKADIAVEKELWIKIFNERGENNDDILGIEKHILGAMTTALVHSMKTGIMDSGVNGAFDCYLVVSEELYDMIYEIAVETFDNLQNEVSASVPGLAQMFPQFDVEESFATIHTTQILLQAAIRVAMMCQFSPGGGVPFASIEDKDGGIGVIAPIIKLGV